MTSALITLLFVAKAGAATSRPLPLALVRDVALPGGATRFDYQWVDPGSRRLYIAHLGADSLLVFDLRAQKVAGEVAGLPSVHGVVAAPERHLVFATVTGDKTLAIIDDRTLTVRARVPAGEYPNGLAFDPKTEKVFVSNNSGPGIGVVDVTKAKPLPSIDIGGGAGNSQYDPVTGRVFVAIHKAAAIAEIDPVAGRLVARHPLSGVKTCHGLVVAAAARRAFAACGGDHPVLIELDLDGRRQIGSHDLPPQVDVLAFDPGLRRLYVSSSTGTASVFELGGEGTLRALGRGFVGPNAHTVAVDPESHQVYFPLEDLGGRPVLRIMAPH